MNISLLEDLLIPTQTPCVLRRQLTVSQSLVVSENCPGPAKVIQVIQDKRGLGGIKCFRLSPVSM